MRKLGAVLLTVSFLAGAPWGETIRHAAAQSPIDQRLPVYRPADKLQGTIHIVGSDTMAQVAAVWAEGFHKFHPNVKVKVEVKNSAAAVEAVAKKTADFGLLSREIQDDEVAAFKTAAGHDPAVVIPALQAVAIFVHKDNPIESLTIDQIDAIFSASLKRGAKNTVATWGDVGVTGEWAKKPIETHIRSEETGTQDYIEKVILHHGKFREDAKKDESNLDLVKAIAKETTAIGFADSMYELPGVKAVPITIEKGHPALSVDEVSPDGHGYPLVRPAHLVMNRDPKAALSAVDAEFIKYVFSQTGQDDVVKIGFAPIINKTAQTSLGAAGLSTIK